jgi:eukaryotic-like serine/threonine-protein kinase
MRTAADGEAFERTIVAGGDPLVGTVLDQRFRIDFQLAAGGFGAIYRATDLLSDAEVALKVLLPKLARDPMVVARFRREGQMLAGLRDPHTITAYELGESPDGTLYIVMELLHGESLYTRFRREGPMPWRRVLHIAAGVCSSLAEAHALGVVHRDLKPANIHLENRDGDTDFVKVLDFGIAKIVQGNIENTQLTQAGQMIGTVDYMSPEQMVGGELTAASDIYTLGVVLYEMISGRTPFADAQTATAILAAVLTRAAEPLSRHAPVPPALDRIIARCLEREAARRYRDVGDLADALAEVAADRLPRLIPNNEFDDGGLTAEATRIDVRSSGSSEPVLDARGARRRLPEQRQITPPGAGTPRPGHAVGSQHAIDVRGLPRGSSPELDLATEPMRPAAIASQPGRPVAIASPVPGAPSPARRAQVTPALPAEVPRRAQVTFAPSAEVSRRAQVTPAPPVEMPRRAQVTPPPPVGAPAIPSQGAGAPAGPSAIPSPLPGAQGGSPAIPSPVPGAPIRHAQVTPAPAMHAPPMPPAMHAPPMPPAMHAPMPPPVRAQPYSAPSYDMTAATSYDKMVRRIVWIAVLLVVIVVIALITR